MAEPSKVPPRLMPAAKPVSLIPVGLKEAALDSPSFRATTLHFGEQVDSVEKWLENFLKSAVRISYEVSTFENIVNGFLAAAAPPVHLSEAVVDHDYTLLAVKRYGEGFKDFWGSVIGGMKKLDVDLLEPIRGFLQNDLRNFKELRRQLDQSQRHADNAQSRYSAQSKTKESSSLREEAFQLHEARKAYLKASMDFSVAAPQLRMSLDKTLVKTFYDHWSDVQTSCGSASAALSKWGVDLERINGWSREMENGERTFRRELQVARKQIEEAAETAARPSRELEDYSGTGSVQGHHSNSASANPKTISPDKQGWLNLRTITGKPARPVWVRRWFFVKSGIFGWLVQGSRSGGVEESEKIGVLLCGIRPSVGEERRFCFEVKTKDTTIVLQAESQVELIEWMGTFDIAKQKCLEDPSSTETPVTTGHRALDPAFSITPPSAPEFAASAADAGTQQATDEYATIGYDRAPTLPVNGGDESSLSIRSTHDSVAHRRSTAMERESESGREQATRIIQKLDLHRKSTVQASATSPLPPGSPSLAPGGIASLIAASHTALPVGPGIQPSIPQLEAQGPRSIEMNMIHNLPPSTLAPSTLVNPPNPTNLSISAVIVSGERGIGIGQADRTGGMPSGIMANLWGSANWGYMNRLEGGELKSEKEMRSASQQPSSSVRRPGVLPKPTTSGSSEQQRVTSLIDKQKAVGVEPLSGHRKTISLDGDVAELQRSLIAPQKSQAFPSVYPLQLKTQDCQFRLLFPNVRRDEKVILVFRASWNPNDQQDFPGRVYVTTESIYFYSNHLGLVLITGLSLSSVSEVTAAPGRDSDFLFLHLKETTEKADFTRITVKVFLEPLRLLQRRLNFLVQNCNSDDPRSIDSVMKALVKLEYDEDEKSPSIESWEDSLVLPMDGPQRNPKRLPQDLRANLFIDQGLFGRENRHGTKKEIARFKLPGKPVFYVPRGMSKVTVEKQFDISPKALFHVLFGDRSAVWQLLYHERRAQRIKQGPWTKQEENHLRRTFEYQIEYLDILRQVYQAKVTDTQIIDVLNDHLCYVVTDRKTPWHLPFTSKYILISKIVITHVAKSKCKLAIYTKVEWTKHPPILSSIVERQAQSDLELDALDLADVITDQVRKLGAQSRTKKAIQIFGGIGQLNQVTEFESSDSKVESQVRRSMGHRTLLHFLFETIVSWAEDIVTSVMMWIGSAMRWTWKTGNANSIILLVLTASVLFNVYFSSIETSEWWRERNARTYMRKLGIGPDLVMSKTVHIDDFDLAVAANTTSFSGVSPSSSCLQTFRSYTSPTSLSPLYSSSSSPTAHRIRRTRQHLGSYRHDLLVAMRVVNTIEREILQAEWEDFILGETHMCERTWQLLASAGDDVRAGNETVRGRKEGVKKRLGEYCDSCQRARTEVFGTVV